MEHGSDKSSNIWIKLGFQVKFSLSEIISFPLLRPWIFKINLFDDNDKDHLPPIYTPGNNIGNKIDVSVLA